MDTDVRGQTNVEQREDRAEVPVCLVLQADGVKERGNGTASLGGKVPVVPDGANSIQSAAGSGSMLILVPVLHLVPRHEVVSEVHKSSYAHLSLDGDDWVDSHSSRFIHEE
jgi:predicted ATP-dependent Lon-type protease